MFLYTYNSTEFAYSQKTNPDILEWVLIGVPFDSTTTYLSGARYGPKAIREASYNFEQYNIILDKQIKNNFTDAGDIDIVPGNFQETAKRIRKTINEIQEQKLKPITIGGEHTITLPIIQEITNQPEELTVIHLDAHTDLRDTYMDEKETHATVIRRVHEENIKQLIQIGIRSSSLKETQYAKSQKNITQYTTQDVRTQLSQILEEIDKITGPIYLTIDLDVLDASQAPSVGTPVPCGVYDYQIEKIITKIREKNIIGIDLVELASTTIGDITSINAAKIILDFLSQ